MAKKLKSSLPRLAICWCIALVAGWANIAHAEGFPSYLDASQLDPDAYMEFVDGVERPVVRLDSKPSHPQDVLRTDSAGKTSFLRFGDSKNPGPRHLRIGFVEPLGIGTVLAVGDVSVSVLKPDAPYPGDMGDDSQWIPAQWIEGGVVTGKEPGSFQCAAWLLPSGTRSRALRFTHVAKTVDKTCFGQLRGVIALSDRLANLAPQAVAAGRTTKDIQKINNEGRDDAWVSWQNFDPMKETRARLIVDDPEWVMLVWPEPVTLRGCAFTWPGFSAGEIQTYTGAEDAAPRDASESDWKNLVSLTGVSTNWPNSFSPHWVGFGKEITTRALKLRMTDVSKDQASSVKRGTADGKRVWLGEWLVFSSLEDKAVEGAVLASTTASVKKNGEGVIPVRFSLPEPGFVTLVIDDAKGFRVRNLISETPFDAGDHTVWWDGSADIVHDGTAARNGVYHIPFQPVALGEYRVHGLWRKEIVKSYEFSVYNPGNPPWNTEDHTGAWVANHSAPQAAVFVPGGERSPTGDPAVFIGCIVTEGPDAVAWVDLDGRKRGGRRWIGGAYTGAPFMAFDTGEKADPAVAVYVGTGWMMDKVKDSSILRLNTLTPAGDSKPVMNVDLGTLPAGTKMTESLRGLSVRNGVLVCSLFHLNELLFVDASPGDAAKHAGRMPLKSPRGSAFDAQGRFLVLSESKLLRFPRFPTAESKPETLVATGLEDPQGITLDRSGNIYVSDWGKSHQVKVFSSAGKFLHAIGNPGEPKAGPYDAGHMNHPWGITVDSQNQLWVAERDQLPRRVSVWTLDGKLAKAFYGPAKYGGGGVIDPEDKTRFYYAQENAGAMEFQLNWVKGTSELVSVYNRRSEDDPSGLPESVHAPELPIDYQGRRYFTNVYNSNPVASAEVAVLFQERDGIAQPVAAMGQGWRWELFKTESFWSRRPEGMELNKRYGTLPVTLFFLWVDTNGDSKIQPEEVEFKDGDCRGVTIMPDLSFCLSNFGGVYPANPGKAMRFAPVSIDERGIPRYDLSKGQVLAENVKFPGSSGGAQALADESGWSVVTLGIGPFDALSLSGAKDGLARWSYPNPWPGLHAGHRAPRHSMPGQVIAPTRLLGGFFPVGKEVLWAVNSDQGGPYVFTRDGLFVATLFEDVRNGKQWRMPTFERGMNLKGLTLGGENFWPTISRTSDDKVWLVDGARCAIVRLDGFDSIQRLNAGTLNVTEKDITRAQELLQQREIARLKFLGSGLLKVALLPDAPIMDGNLEDWAGADWVEIDQRGRENLSAAVSISGNQLFAAWKSSYPTLLANSGENDLAPFKTGGALDLMIGADPHADPKRQQPVPGDLRLLITRIPLNIPKEKIPKFQTKALLYRAVVPGTKDSEKVPFSSPWRTIYFDKVEDISGEVTLAEDKKGNFEISVPLERLGLKPEPGTRIRGDIGVLQGNGSETTARVYWSNKASAIVSDVPAEAQLTPALWGNWEIEKR